MRYTHLFTEKLPAQYHLRNISRLRINDAAAAAPLLLSSVRIPRLFSARNYKSQEKAHLGALKVRVRFSSRRNKKRGLLAAAAAAAILLCALLARELISILRRLRIQRTNELAFGRAKLDVIIPEPELRASEQDEELRADVREREDSVARF